MIARLRYITSSLKSIGVQKSRQKQFKIEELAHNMRCPDRNCYIKAYKATALHVENYKPDPGSNKERRGLYLPPPAQAGFFLEMVDSMLPHQASTSLTVNTIFASGFAARTSCSAAGDEEKRQVNGEVGNDGSNFWCSLMHCAEEGCTCAAGLCVVGPGGGVGGRGSHHPVFRRGQAS